MAGLFYFQLICLWWSFLATTPSFGVIDQAFMDNLIKLQQNDGVTRDQLQKWWQLTYNRRHARVFPICITKHRGAYPPQLAKWGPILDDIEAKNERNFKKTAHLHDVHHSTIIKFLQREVYQSNVIDGNYHRFLQWIHLHFTTNGYVAKGFLLQAITGPLGLPGGEFDNKMFCFKTDLDYFFIPNLQKDVPNWNKVSFTHPCSISPRSTTVWPNIFVLDGTRVSPDFTSTELSVRFRWTEAQCQETGFFQFILIITSTFRADDYEIKLSPIFKLNRNPVATGSGIPPNAYLGFVGTEGYHCNPPAPLVDEKIRIVPNPEHDHCVTTGEGRDNHFTCPPGPFRCGNLWSSGGNLQSKVDEWQAVHRQKNNWHFEECCQLGELPPDPPTTTTIPTTTRRRTTSLKPEEQLEKGLGDRAAEAEKASQVTHGDICVLVWLVILPIADHIARYYKDFPDYKKIGLGFWIIAHVLLHIVGLVLIWSSFGLVVGTGDNGLGNVSGAHFCLGAFTTILQHLGYFTALQQLKELSVSETFKYVVSHAMGGKSAFFFAFLSIVLSNAEPWKRGACVGLVVIRIIFMLITMYVESKQDATLGVFHRARRPILQRIVMVGRARPPYMRAKFLVLSLMVIVLLSGFVFIKVYFKK